MQPRRHDLDALRTIAFALLIAYHLCMLYVLDWDWHIKSSYLAEWLQWPMLFVNRWRMDLIFLVSGIAAAITGKLSAIWEGAKAQVKSVADGIHTLYNRAVGHSDIPDLVNRRRTETVLRSLSQALG